MGHEERKLLRDDNGRLVDNDNNKYLLGYWGTVWTFYGYKGMLKEGITNASIVSGQAFNLLLFILVEIALTVLFPFSHFICGWANYRKAKRVCIEEDKARKCRGGASVHDEN